MTGVCCSLSLHFSTFFRVSLSPRASSSFTAVRRVVKHTSREESWSRKKNQTVCCERCAHTQKKKKKQKKKIIWGFHHVADLELARPTHNSMVWIRRIQWMNAQQSSAPPDGYKCLDNQGPYIITRDWQWMKNGSTKRLYTQTSYFTQLMISTCLSSQPMKYRPSSCQALGPLAAVAIKHVVTGS